MATALLAASRRRPALLALCAAALVPATVPAAASAAKKPVFPTITKVSPDKARVGETLTIRGANYLVGRNKTTVVFKRDGRKPFFAKADLSTKTLIKITVPKALTTELATTNGYAIFTKFRLRIGAKRFGEKYSNTTLSVGPEVQADVDVDQCAKVRTGTDPSGDLDGDLLTNAEELGLPSPLNPCAADTDGDTLTDGWEYFSGKDLNQRALPYPGAKPFPNALSPDADDDHDGDGLTAKQEFALWQKFGKPAQTFADRDQLLYSDGTQTSSGPGPDQRADLPTLQANAGACGITIVPPSLGYLSNGYVNPAVPIEDDVKDADHDGLSNWSEANGTMTQAWWKRTYKDEVAYPLRKFADTELTTADTDGDGCLDGLDDQDADDWPNWTEQGDHDTTWADGAVSWGPFLSGSSYPNWYGWGDSGGDPTSAPFAAQPFNPCLPQTSSRTCSNYDIGTTPFSDEYKDPTTCRRNIVFRGVTVSVWIWDPYLDVLWKGTCP